MPRGDDLERLVRDMTTAERRVMSAAARAVQTSLRESVDTGYQTRTDVNGKTYIPAKDGHLPQMEREGSTLRSAYRYSITEGGRTWFVTIIERTPYGQFLRDGTPKMKPRQHIPKPEDALPQSWFANMKIAVDSSVSRVMA